jgi:hypothetical protein
MKLYEAPRNSRIRIVEDTNGPPSSSAVTKGDVLRFCNIDGMYSLCFDSNDQPIHIDSNTEVEVL